MAHWELRFPISFGVVSKSEILCKVANYLLIKQMRDTPARLQGCD
jgi:hypothetical protein